MVSCSEPGIFWSATQYVNAPRVHLFEYGYTFPQDINHVESLVAVIEDRRSSLPETVRSVLKVSVGTFTGLEAQIATLDTEITQRSKTDPNGTSADDDPGCRTDCLDGHYSLGTGR
jgi:hypothetical protein